MQRISCQLTAIDDVKRRNSSVNHLWQYRVRYLRRLKRRAVFMKNRVLRSFRGKNRVSRFNEYPPIHSGDLVRVRLKDEIRNTLDDHERHAGCLFVDEMYECCGKQFNVLKPVEQFFDETKQKLCRTKDLFILAGVHCSGRQRLYRVSCDRHCFFFWHRLWLEKIN